ncbi:MAG: hypothetical protein AAF351_01155 [Pseudomonadota bacterium]
MSFFEELKRRNVFKVAAAYAVVSWVLLQIVDVVAPILELPESTAKLVLLLLLIGSIPALIFSWAFEMTPEGIKKESEVDRSKSITSQTGKKLNFVIVGALVLAVGLLLFERQTTRGDSDTSVAADAGEEDALDPSIAVLPFVNMTSDPEQEYFSDGISEEILNSLAAVQELKVAGRTSSFAFKGNNQDLRLIGDALDVNHILEGSVRKAGDQVRITAQLIRADNGFHLWSETYDRELDNIFEIQDEIAAEILSQLKPRLLEGQVSIADGDRTTPAAYEIFLRARQRIYGRVGSEIEKAVKELDEVIRMDPEYAPAYAQRGIATMLLSETQYGDIPRNEANRRGKRFVEQSLKLSPDLPEGWAGLGLYYADYPLQHEEGIAALRHALELNPNLIDASNWLNNALRDSGDMRGAIQVLTALVERDPFYRPGFSNAILQFNSFGETEKAAQLLQRMEQLDPDSPDILMARSINLMFSGHLGESLKVMEERNALGSMSGVARLYLGIGYINTGQFQKALDQGHQFLHVDPLYELGRIEEAYSVAGQYAEQGFPSDLFGLYLRDDRPQDVVDYVQERWPTIELFAAENIGDDFGWDTMEQLALAYHFLGRVDDRSEALMLYERHLLYMQEQGVDNIGLANAFAVFHGMNGDLDAAFEYLDRSLELGMSMYDEPSRISPQARLFMDDPRFAAVEEAMREIYNVDRAAVGLPPVDENYDVISEESL